MPYGPSSAAKDLVRPSTAAQAMPKLPTSGRARRAASAVNVMITPRP